MFKLETTTKAGRKGLLHTSHGLLQTPFFMPCATAGALKGMTMQHAIDLGAEILLSNTYHLHLSPGEKIVNDAGGLHEFMGWDKPILTDSGGYQVFSLEAIRKITDDGVEFRNHRSGDQHFIGPKEAMRIQHALSADIIMCFDECPPSTAPRADQIKAVDRTLKWAKVCKEEHERMKAEKAVRAGRAETKNLSAFSALPHIPALFAIIQGGLERDLRTKCAEELIAIGFDGYAVGGLAVGETEKEMFEILDIVCPLLPNNAPRYLMGVGDRAQIKEAVKRGIDMFDCVAPTREGRHGNIWLSDGTKLRIRRAEYATDHSPIDPRSPAPTSQKHLRSYLHHLLRIGERYGETLAVLQNVAVTLEMIRTIRKEIEGGASNHKRKE